MSDTMITTHFKSWDDLVADAEQLEGLACYKLGVLLYIYGVERAGTETNENILRSLERRGYGLQPQKIVGFSADTWVRVYKKDSTVGRALDAIHDITPGGNIFLRKMLRDQERREDIERLVALAKSIARD